MGETGQCRTVSLAHPVLLAHTPNVAVAPRRVSPYLPLASQILLAKSGPAHTFRALYAEGDCETQNKESGGETL